MEMFFLIAISQRLQTSSLVLGVIAVIAGLLLMRGHQAVFDGALTPSSTRGARNYEFRKLRRRTIVAALVTSVGFMLSAIYWVREVKVLAILTLLIILQLAAILVLALVDFLFVGLRAMTSPDGRRQREMFEQILRARQEEQSAEQNRESQE
jgi:uncharacterized membrane protein (UPF0136 family)